VVEIGHVAAANLFGARTGSLLSALIALALVSSVSAMIMVGPRVYEAMGADYSALRFLCFRHREGGPWASIALQTALAMVMLVTVSFDTLLVYIGFTLSLATALTVLGVFIHRWRWPEAPPYRTWGYPVTPIVFAGFTAWMIAYAIAQRPVESLSGLGTVLLGYVLYMILQRSGGANANSKESSRASSAV
jgi:APA family basic amino acid/polyamine antiporter